MTNHELLEAAASAAGMLPAPAGVDCGEGGPMSKGGLVFSGNGECIDWNPLTDDRDALRLAVKLQIGLEFGEDFVYASLATPQATYEDTGCGQDLAAATRRAIVRAAAIGRSYEGEGKAP